MTDSSEKEIEQLAEFIEENDVDGDRFGAYYHGVNVGIELAQSSLGEARTRDEVVEFIRKMYLKRVQEDA